MVKDNTEEQAKIFAVLSDPTRLRIVKLLCQQAEPYALCVKVLTESLGVSQPAISQHLRVLKSAGLVEGQRRGYHIHYSVKREVIKQWQGLISTTLATTEQENTKGKCHLNECKLKQSAR